MIEEIPRALRNFRLRIVLVLQFVIFRALVHYDLVELVDLVLGGGGGDRGGVVGVVGDEVTSERNVVVLGNGSLVAVVEVGEITKG
jgi:hypothetical protein